MKALDSALAEAKQDYQTTQPTAQKSSYTEINPVKTNIGSVGGVGTGVGNYFSSTEDWLKSLNPYL